MPQLFNCSCSRTLVHSRCHPPGGVRFGFLLLLIAGGAAVIVGILGSLTAITAGTIGNPYLVAFATLYAVTVTVPEYPVWQNLSLGIHVNFGAMSLGVNVVGIALLLLHRRLVRSIDFGTVPRDPQTEPVPL